MKYAILVFAGALLCNCVPHLAAGLQGAHFPTPFAKPRGVGKSAPLTNFFWGAFNLAAALAILGSHPVFLGANADCLAIGSGAFVLGVHLSRHFGKVRDRAGDAPFPRS